MEEGVISNEIFFNFLLFVFFVFVIGGLLAKSINKNVCDDELEGEKECSSYMQKKDNL